MNATPFRIVGVLLLLVLTQSAAAANLTIPATHPRLWYGNAARLAQARSYFVTNPFTPSGSDQTDLNYLRALRDLVRNNGTNTDCDQAVAHLVAWRAENQGVGNRDALRQQGEGLLLIYDWCHHRLSGPQITTLVALWNGYMDQENTDGFANQGSEGNNYFWGRVRNNLMWGIASFNDNARAQEFINNSLDLRLGQWFAVWYNNFGRGGVFPEGADYGVVMLSYPIFPFASAADFGFDPYAQTPFFREAIYALIYGTTPGPTTITGSFSGGYLAFPYNDDEHFQDGSAINVRDYLGDFARHQGQRAPTVSGNAKAARAWASVTNAGRRWIFDAVGGTGAVADLTGLTLDYFAPGAAVLSARTAHDANATQLYVQLNTPGGIEHRHLDAGSFQIWRKGRWLTRESTGYSDVLVGFNNVGTAETDRPVAHNGLLFQGRSTARWIGSGPVVIPPGAPHNDQPDGLPRVFRLHHANDFAYIATDFSQAYRNTDGRRVDWPYAEIAIREILFIRPLGVTLILDRMRASSDSLLAFYGTASWNERTDPLALRIPAAQVQRTFLMHFETQPTAVTNRLSATVGNQISELVTLLPAAPVFRVINEDRPGDELAGQYRLELDSTGTAESYFLNVIYGRDVGQAQMAVTLTDNGPSWTIALNHPTLGTASVVLVKGMMSSGGTVTIGAGTPQVLYSGVQPITVTTEGPVWGEMPLFMDSFETPTG